MVSKPDPDNNHRIELSSDDIEPINKVIDLIKHYSAAEIPQELGIEMCSRYMKDHPDDDTPRDIAITTCAIMSVTRMLKGLVEALDNAKPNG